MKRLFLVILLIGLLALPSSAGMVISGAVASYTKLGGPGYNYTAGGLFTNYTYMDQSTPLTAGVVKEWKFYIAAGGASTTATGKIFRVSGGNYTLVGSTEAFDVSPGGALSFVSSSSITCQTGDYIGVYVNGSVDGYDGTSGTTPQNTIYISGEVTGTTAQSSWTCYFCGVKMGMEAGSYQ
jgi:hypothetical protein